MTFDEAMTLFTRIEHVVLGTAVRGLRIDSFFIGPTDWDCLPDYINKQFKDGPGAAMEAFSEKSFSVYGVHRDESGMIPRQQLVQLDEWEKVRSN